MINMGLAICLASQLLWDFLSLPSEPQPPCARITGKQPHQLSFSVGSRDLNSCFNAYLASALPAETSLHPGHAFLLLVMCGTRVEVRTTFRNCFLLSVMDSSD